MVVDCGRTVCNSYCVVEACDIGLLWNEGYGYLAGRATGCECWDGDSVDGGVGSNAGIFPFREGGEFV